MRNLVKTFKVARRKAGLFSALRGVFHRDYYTVRALDGISFDIGAGELVGYIGPNGAGKSTTIKVMSGILVPDSGSCTIMGLTPWQARTRHVRNLGVVFGQRTQLWWDVPVIDSYELLRDIYNVPQADYRRTLGELNDCLNLGPLLEVPVRQLSLGQRIRCELAASLLHQPPILFLDEPTIGLDAVSKLAVRQFIRHQNIFSGTTVILTTHDMDDIQALCSRVMLIANGAILFDGSVEKLKQRYAAEKRLKADFLNPPRMAPLSEKVTLIESRGNRLELSFPAGQLSVPQLVRQLAAMGELRDITVEEPPIEEVIARIYGELGL